MKFYYSYCRICLCLLFSTAVYADDTDMRLLLDENTRQMKSHRNSHLALPDAVAADDHLIAIGGQTYHVGDNEAELASAIFHALNARQWDKAAQFLARYRQLPQQRAGLVLMTEGLLARQRGDYRAAIASMRQAGQAALDDARIVLELARLLAEDNQNREAGAAFQAALALPLPESTQDVIQSYLNTIEKRSDWHGQISVGYGHNNNINQANGNVQCAWKLMDDCLAYRQLPQPVSSAVTQYSAVVSKTQPLAGHHNLYVRGLLYGTRYARKDKQNTIAPDYSNHTATLYAGYDYADKRNHVQLLPFIEYDYRNKQANHRAWGINAEWTRQIGTRWQMGVNGSRKYTDYIGGNRLYFADYAQSRLGLSAQYALSANSLLYADADVYRNKYPNATASSKEWGLRGGVYAQLGRGFYVNTLLQHKRSRSDAASLMLANGARREDKQTLLMAAVGARQWQYQGISPELRIKRTLSRSNSDFYRYAQTELMLNFKYHF